MRLKVSIIILNWNNYEDTKECFESLAKVTYPNCEVVFVDNCSTDGSTEKLRAEFPQHPFIQTGANLGFSGGCNAGIRYAIENGADYIMLLNNDTVVKEDFLEPLVQAFENNEDLGLVGGKAYFYDDPNRIHMAGAEMDWLRATYKRYGDNQIDHGQFDRPREVGFVSAYFMLVKKEVFTDVTLLSEDYFGGVEECEFVVEAKKAGYKIHYIPNSVIWHKIGRSFTPGTPRGVYNCYRNKLIFMRKYMSPLKWQLWRFGFCMYAKTLGILKRAMRAKKYGFQLDLKVTRMVINKAIKDSKTKSKVTAEDLNEIDRISFKAS